MGIVLEEFVEVCEKLGDGFDGVNVEGVAGEELDVFCPFDADDGNGWRRSEEGGKAEFYRGRMESKVG